MDTDTAIQVWRAMTVTTQAQVHAHTPTHLLREPAGSDWRHELFQKSLLLTKVCKLVTDQNQRFHQGTFLHLSQ